jgi:hypothetical protein
MWRANRAAGQSSLAEVIDRDDLAATMREFSPARLRRAFVESAGLVGNSSLAITSAATRSGISTGSIRHASSPPCFFLARPVK